MTTVQRLCLSQSYEAAYGVTNMRQGDAGKSRRQIMPTSASGYVTIPSVLEDHLLMHEQVIRGGQDTYDDRVGKH
jgi:hypothetical protein